MSTTTTVILVLSLFSFKINSFLNENEVQVVLDVSQKLKISHCILVREKIVKNDLVANIKLFSNKSIFVTSLNHTELSNYIRQEIVSYPAPVIVLKESLMNLERFMKTFKTVVKINKVFEVNKSDRISQFIWMIFTEHEKIQNYHLGIPYDCEFLIIQSRDGIAYQLTEVYQLGKFEFYLDFGNWSRTSSNITDTFEYSRKLNLNGTLVLVTGENVQYQPDIPRQRILLEMLDDFSRIANIKFRRVVEPSNLGYGPFMAELNKHLHVANTAAFWSADFFFIANINPIYKRTLNWYIKYPDTELRPDFYLQPFDFKLWTLLTFSVIIGSFLLIFVYKVLKSQSGFLIDDAFISFESFCNQSGSDDVKNISSRIICISLRITSIIFTLSFGAVITSFISVPVVKVPFSNLYEFFENGEYRFLIYRGALRDVLKSMKPKITDNYLDLIYETNVENPFQRICREKLAYVELDNDLYNMPEVSITCQLIQIQHPLAFMWMTFGLYPDNPLKGLINYIILRFYESGIQSKLQNIAVGGSVPIIEKDSFTPIVIEQMVQVLSIPFVGVLLAVIVVFGEFLCAYIAGRSG